MISDSVLRTLSGPCKSDRLTALKGMDNDLSEDVLRLMIAIEEVQTTLTDYRNKERFLDDLLKLVLHQPENTQVAIFHHLLGTLYVNFERFWGPTVRVIIELLNITKYQTKLLHILLDELKLTNDSIYGDNVRELPEDRPDYVLHRNFILQILAKFTRFVELNSVIFMDQLFRFIEGELMRSPFIEKLARQDLSKSESNIKDGRRRIETSASKSKETFITVSRIIQSFKKMEKVHKHIEFKEFILDVMTSRDASMQKAAFNCLTAFDIEHVRPYADKILRLLDDKKIRSELSVFSIDSDTGLINTEHRRHLIPIIHRILFGRMVGQVGKKTSGRDKGEKRKSTVMRYIAGCTADEIIDFFKLLFDPIFKYSDLAYDELIAAVKTDTDIKSYVPLNKLQAMLSTLGAYMESVANLKPETLPCLFKMINIVSLQVLIPLDNIEKLEQLDTRTTKTLKILKRNCLEISTEFFKSFPYYRFTQDEIDFVFGTLIWPCTDGFIDKNYAAVTPALKLIGAFLENDVYHKLMVKRNKSCQNSFLLDHLMNLYNSDKIERPVSRHIAQMISSLLKLRDDDVDMQVEDEIQEESYQIDDRDSILPDYDSNLYNISGDLTLGLSMLMPYVPSIFDRLKKNCMYFLDKKDSNYRLENNELLILSTLSCYIKDSSQCLIATKLLLTTLGHQKNGDLILNTLRTTQTLMTQVKEIDDSVIINFIANALSYQRNVEQRKELCKLLGIVAEIDCNLRLAVSAVQEMNAYNEDIVDAPDLARWNHGFNLAFEYLQMLSENDLNDPNKVQRSLTLLLHQIGFIISTVDKYEFSIRENCSIFYEKLAPKINLIDKDRNSKLLKELLSDIILEKFLKKGLRDTNDLIKHSYLGILRTLALNCHDQHAVLRDCHMFCNTNQDLDFWLNIKHIQLHNRSRALARLINDANLYKVSSKTLSSYFMPLAGGFLFNKNYKSVASLSDNSIKLIGIICSQLNWNTYESTLSYYLDLLTKSSATYQRTNIKVITEILKNFNYDLTACEEAMQYEEENKKLEKRLLRRCGEIAQQAAIDACDKKVRKLNPSTSRAVYTSVMKKLIPRLNSCLNEMTRTDFEYDKNMADYKPEKDEIKRIPMAFAIALLLNLLPGKYVLFREQLPPLFLKLTTFLRSKNEPTRKAARATLLRIMSLVGPAYLPDMLRVLKQQLDKGFYVHVLNYTVHSVLNELNLNYGDLDSSIDELVSLCRQEIFGKPSEDKEIAQILAKTSEAKKTKSYDTLSIIATHVSAEKLVCLINPLKDLIKTSTEPKVVNKLSQCLQRIFTGLSQNKDFPLDSMIKFIQESIQESIPNLRVRQKVETNDMAFQPVALREDRFLIVKEKSKDRVKSKINEKGNLHMVVENSLRLLSLMFEKNKLVIKRKETLQRKLDGLIGLLATCLKSSSPRCVMRALKCLYFIAQTKIDLPTFESKCNSIVKKIFILLSLYNGVGMVHGDNYEMIGMCFKTLTLLLLRCEHVQLNPRQVRALMSYIEQDLHDASRQSTAFKALNSLLHKKCDSPELADIMNKVADLLITSNDESVRLLSVKSWETYLFEYKHESTALQSHLTKFLRQIDYEYVDGRKSILRMLRVIVEKIPERILRSYLELYFHLLAQRVVNDDSKEVRELVGRLISLLMQRLPDKQTHLLNKFIVPWATGGSLELRMLGIKLISIVLEANPRIFEKNTQRLLKVLTILNDTLNLKDSDKTTSDRSNQGDTEEIDGPEEIDENTSPTDQHEPLRKISTLDKVTYHSLRLFKRLLEKDIIKCVETRYIDCLKTIWQNIATSKLNHWHEPIVLTSCDLYIMFLTRTTLGDALQVDQPKANNYLEWNAVRIVRLLCDRFIDLLDRFDSTNPIYAYLMQGLITLGQMVAKSRATKDFEQRYVESFENSDVIGHMLQLKDLPNDGFARKEAALYRLSQSYRRDLILRWTAAIAQELGSARVSCYVFLYLMTPVRELTDKAKNKPSDNPMAPSLIPLAEDLLKFIKGLVGVEQFNQIYSRVQLHYTRRRVERKKNIAVAKIRDQTGGSKRKIDDNKKKQASKKRRIAGRKSTT